MGQRFNLKVVALLETYGYWWYPSIVEIANICNTILDGWYQQQFVNHACYSGEVCTLCHSRSCMVAFKSRVQPWSVRGRLFSVKRVMPSESQGKMWLTYFNTSIGWLEKAMAPHSSTLAWKIPWREEPGRLQSMGSLRVGHDWATSLSLFTFMHWRRKWQPTQCCYLESPRDGAAWWAARVAQSQTRLTRLSSSSIGWQSMVQSWCAAVHGVTKSQTLLSDWTELSRVAGSWRLKDEQELYLVWKRRIVWLGDLM